MNTNKSKNVIQLIEQNKNGLLVVNDEALEVIQNLNDHIGVIVAVGKKRLGKSFMLNRLIGIESQNGFEISHIDEPCTKGIYMSTKIIDHSNKNGEKMKLILLDTEGLESNEASKEWDHKIFVLSLLLSSYFVYNTTGTYTRDDLEKLSFVTQISKKIRKNSSTEMDMNDFPQLMWVCRDYKFEIKDENAGCDALRKFVKTHFDSENLNKTKDCFVNSFKNIDGFYLPFPDLEHPNGLSSKKILLAIENYKWDDFSGEFYDQMNELCQKIKENVQIKMFNEKKLNGKIFSEFIKKVVEKLNDKKIILVVDMVEALIKIESNRNLDEIKKIYSDKLRQVFSKLPMKWESMNSIEEKARNECLDELKKKIEETYFKEYEDLFISFCLNKKDNSGIFSDYIKKNKMMIEKNCDDEFQNLEANYKNRMNERLLNASFIENFESFENDLGNKLFGEFKEKVKDFCTNKSESIINLKLCEEKFKKLRENLDFRRKFLEKYLEKEWNSIRLECDKQDYITLSQYEVSVSNFEKKYSNLRINEPQNSRCWTNYYGRNYESLKTLLKNKIEQDRLKKQKDELEKIKKNLPSPNYNFFDLFERDREVVPIRNAVKDESVICDECGQICKNSHGLAIHKGKMHKNTSYDYDSFTCDECGKIFKNSHGLAIHKGKMH